MPETTTETPKRGRRRAAPMDDMEPAPKTNGRAGPPQAARGTLDAESQKQQLKDDLAKQVDRLYDAFIGGVNATGGSESASIDFKAAFHPGGEKSHSRFEVTAAAKIKTPTIDHEAAMQDGQIRMFED